MSLKIKVKCPYCQAERLTQSVKKVLCFRCGRWFRVYYKAKGKGFVKSTIVEIKEGTKAELFKKFAELKEKDQQKKEKIIF